MNLLKSKDTVSTLLNMMAYREHSHKALYCTVKITFSIILQYHCICSFSARALPANKLSVGDLSLEAQSRETTLFKASNQYGRQ